MLSKKVTLLSCVGLIFKRRAFLSFAITAGEKIYPVFVVIKIETSDSQSPRDNLHTFCIFLCIAQKQCSAAFSEDRFHN